MTSEKLLELIGKMDDYYVEEAALERKPSRKRWIAFAAAAAIVVLAIAIPFAVQSLQARSPAADPHVEQNPPVPPGGEIDVAASTAATEETEESTAQLAFVPQYGAFGQWKKTVALSDEQVARLKEQEDLASLARYPTLVDQYPSNQGGFLIDITPAMRERETAQGQDFLAHCYGAEPSDYPFELRESVADHVMFYENEELSAVANLGTIHFQLTAPYEGELTAETIAEQPIVKAALEWRGIETAEIREEVMPKVNGEPSEFIFTYAAHCDDPVEQLLNFTFREVTARVYMPERLFSVSIGYDEPKLEEAETPAVTPEQLEAFLAKTFPDAPPTEYVTEIFYSSNVESGKYIPCYRVYLLEPELPRVAGRTVYSVLEVTTAEIVDAAE